MTVAPTETEAESPAEHEVWVARVDDLMETLGLEHGERSLFERALTHPSWCAEQADPPADYQRLEFLGDAVVGLAVSALLFRRFPDQSEGELSRMRSRLVSRKGLAQVARKVGLGPVIRLGVGEARSQGRNKDRILADVLEAVVGAVYLGTGPDEARDLVERLLADAVGTVGEAPDRRDHKSALQVLCQEKFKATPRYAITGSEGPPHETLFAAEVSVSGRKLGSGTGLSKQLAQQAAAADALARFDSDEDEGADP